MALFRKTDFSKQSKLKITAIENESILAYVSYTMKENYRVSLSFFGMRCTRSVSLIIGQRNKETHRECVPQLYHKHV